MVRATLWRDRSEAGQALAQRLTTWRDNPQALVVGLPRGGIVVAAEVCRSLGLPLASWAVRKLAHPQAPELALGAIAPGGVLLWEPPSGGAFGLDAPLRQRLVEEQSQELQRRQRLYGDPDPAELRHRPLLLVDDGVATGLTVRAAVQSLRMAHPSRLVLAVPVIDQRIATALRPQLDGLIALAEVEDLWAVGTWYEHFEPVSDQEVLRLIARCSGDRANSGVTPPLRETPDQP
jgi:putative phosphoribosyl transferase